MIDISLQWWKSPCLVAGETGGPLVGEHVALPRQLGVTVPAAASRHVSRLTRRHVTREEADKLTREEADT